MKKFVITEAESGFRISESDFYNTQKEAEEQIKEWSQEDFKNCKGKESAEEIKKWYAIKEIEKSLLQMTDEKDEKGKNDWLKKAEAGETVRIM